MRRRLDKHYVSSPVACASHMVVWLDEIVIEEVIQVDGCLDSS